MRLYNALRSIPALRIETGCLEGFRARDPSDTAGERQIDSFGGESSPSLVTRSDSMAVIPIDRSRRAPSIVADDGPMLSYEKCLERLARVVAEPDSRHLDEVARLIGKLTVTIE
jgi:hypothetical protein